MQSPAETSQNSEVEAVNSQYNSLMQTTAVARDKVAM